MRIAIFSGSFNPIHNGHIALARWYSQQPYIDRVWLIVSPNNPLKSEDTLIEYHHREEMARLAISPYPELEICDIESYLPRPNYTIDTLKALEKRHPQDQFSLIIGADNWNLITKWKHWQQLIDQYHLYVYPRPDVQMAPINHPNVCLTSAPEYPISATEIRNAIVQNRPIGHFISQSVCDYIHQNHLYGV